MGFSDIYNGQASSTPASSGTALGVPMPSTISGVQNAASSINTSAPGASVSSLSNPALNNASTTTLGMGIGSNPLAAQQMQNLQDQQNTLVNQQNSAGGGGNTSSVGGKIGGALQGFGQGAQIGGMFGPIGGLIGGGLGAIGSLFS
jgi:hypothetical protein